MLKIRLQRIGRKNNPSFQIIVTDSRQGPKSGKYIEKLGSYDPRKDTKTIKTNRALYWISKGAQVSGTVHNLLVGEGVIKGDKINVLPKKSPIIKEKKEEKEEKKKDDDDKESSDEKEVKEELSKEEEKKEEKSEEVKEDPKSEEKTKAEDKESPDDKDKEEK